jgi:hypothetical protein
MVLIYMIKKNVDQRSDIFVIIYVIAFISFFAGEWAESTREKEKQKIFCHMESKYVKICDYSNGDAIMDAETR